MMLFITGCATTGSAKPAMSSDIDLFAPLPLPPDCDRTRAALLLHDIPDDPPAPPHIEVTPTIELPQEVQRKLERAESLLGEQQYTQAVSQIENVLNYDANNHKAHRMMALACLLSGSDTRAKLSAERALTVDTGDLICHYVLGRLLDKSGKSDLALRKYRTALKCTQDEDSTPYRVLTNYHLGMLLESKCYFAAAVGQFESFQNGLRILGEEIPGIPELSVLAEQKQTSVALRMARANQMLGRYRPAARVLASACESFPDDLDLRTEYIRALVRDKQMQKAAEQAKKLVADAAGKANTVELLMAVCRFAGRPRQGLAVLKEVVDRQPDNTELVLSYVDQLTAVQKYDRAQRELKDLLVRHPDSVQAQWKLIELRRLRADWQNWLADLAKRLTADPSDYQKADTELERITLSTAKSIADEALGKIKLKQKYLPDDLSKGNFASAFNYLLGRLCDRCDRLRDAGPLFQQSINQPGGFLPATVGLAEMYVRRCRWNDALKVLQEAKTKLHRPIYQLEKLLAQCYDGLDDYTQAVAHYEKAIQLNASDISALMLLGRLYERYGMLRNAQLQYQSAVNVAPDSIEARETLIRNLWSRRQDQPDVIGRVVAELMEIQKLHADGPATIRCAAMVKYLTPQQPDLEAYARQLQQLVKLFPDDLRAREDLANTLFALRRYESARVQLDELLARDRYAPSANYMMAEVLSKLLQYGRAREQFERLLDWYPNRRPWITGYAEFLVTMQDYDRAVEIWNLLKALGEKNNDTKLVTSVRAKLIQTYTRARRFDRAGEIALNWLADTDPENQALITLLRTLLLSVKSTAKDYQGYLRLCRKWYEEDPDSRGTRKWLWSGLIGTGQFDEAIIQILQWSSQKPEKGYLLDWLAETLQYTQQHDQAVEIVRSRVSAAEKHQDRYSLLNLLTSVYIKARRYDQAVANHKKAYMERSKMTGKPAVGDDEYELQESMGRILSRVGYLDEAVQHINRTIRWVDARYIKARELRKQTDDKRYVTQLLIEEQKGLERKARLLRSLSVIYQQKNRPDLAEERLREARRLIPLDVGTNNDLGYTLADAGKNLDEAEKMIRYAVGEDPRQPAYMDSLGWVLYKKGEFNRAFTWLKRAANLEAGQDPVIYNHLGDTCWRLNKKEQAVANWKQSLTLHHEQVKDEFADPDEQLVESVKQKIKKAETAGTPDVARISAKGDQ